MKFYKAVKKEIVKITRKLMALESTMLSEIT